MSRVGVLTFIEPQLPTLVDQPPEGASWIHEVKHDGFRTLLVIERGTVRAFTRNGHDWTERYLGIVVRAKRLPCRSAILDGEIIVQDKRGASDFDALQFALRARGTPLIFYAFDLLHHDGRDWRNTPLLERRDRLKAIIEPDSHSVIQFSEQFAGDRAGLVQSLREAPA